MRGSSGDHSAMQRVITSHLSLAGPAFAAVMESNATRVCASCWNWSQRDCRSSLGVRPSIRIKPTFYRMEQAQAISNHPPLTPPSPHPTLLSPHPHSQPTLLSSAVPKWLMRLRWWPNTIIFCPPSSLSMTYSLHDGGHTYHLKYTRAHPIPPHPCSDILDGRELEIGCPLVQ